MEAPLSIPQSVIPESDGTMGKSIFYFIEGNVENGRGRDRKLMFHLVLRIEFIGLCN